MDGRIRANFPELPPMVGFACTAAFRSRLPAAKGRRLRTFGEQVEQFAELPGPAVMVFQDLDDPPVGATFGEVMCSVYKAFGSTGLITSGGGRDLLQVQAIDYPVFTGSTICAHAYCHILHVGLPVRVGGLVVNSGDLLHGDANGVTNIPKDLADEVADVTQEFFDAEKIVLDYVNGNGKKTPAGLAAARKEYSAVVAKLTDRVKPKAKRRGRRSRFLAGLSVCLRAMASRFARRPTASRSTAGLPAHPGRARGLPWRR